MYLLYASLTPMVAAAWPVVSISIRASSAAWACLFLNFHLRDAINLGDDHPLYYLVERWVRRHVGLAVGEVNLWCSITKTMVVVIQRPQCFGKWLWCGRSSFTDCSALESLRATMSSNLTAFGLCRKRSGSIVVGTIAECDWVECS